MKPESLYTLSERVSTELSPERPERVTLLVARTAVEELEVPLLRGADPELLLLTVPSAEELLLLTVVPVEALPLEEERVPLTVALLLEEEERVLEVVAALPLVERLLLEEAELVPLEERVTCWLLVPEALLVLEEDEEEPEVERLTCWLLEELVERDTVADELEREAEDALLERVAEEPELLRVACEEDELEPLLERVWAIISGAVTRDRAISTIAAIVIKRLIASNF